MDEKRRREQMRRGDLETVYLQTLRNAAGNLVGDRNDTGSGPYMPGERIATAPMAPRNDMRGPLPGMRAPGPGEEIPIDTGESLVTADGHPRMPEEEGPPIGPKELREFTRILQKYKTGKVHLERRVIAAENWWKLRNNFEEEKETLPREGYKSRSAWLHNVITSKHADAMEAYPEANILPREAGDREEAQRLSSIIPCILEQNGFEATWSDVAWRKLKTGTGVYKIIWDPDKLNGLGDISIQSCELLNLFWEPGVRDIQDSPYFFHTALADSAELESHYPQLQGKSRRGAFRAAKFLYDDTVDTEDKTTVIDVYYHRSEEGRRVLHYCKYVGDVVLYSTENEGTGGIYDHGKYPFVFDPLFPVEGSPCGYGFVDLCANPQTAIDLMRGAVVKNTIVGATPRYFAAGSSAVNEDEFRDVTQEIIHVSGSLDERSVKLVDYKQLSGNHLNAMQSIIQELRETSGNTETATGSTSAGVTAASAIAALQEASGKGSRDSSRASYRAFTGVVDQAIELVRQFYTLPRQFRILGQSGEMQFTSYDNSGLRPQQQPPVGGMDMGMRLPVFDIKVEAQKRNAYTRMSQNELALQLFGAGLFNPQIAEQALICLEMMEFEGKEQLVQKVSQQATMVQRLQTAAQLALSLAQQFAPALLPQIAAQLGMEAPQDAPAPMPAGRVPQGGLPDGENRPEHGLVQKARQRANEASQPEGGGAK